MKKFQGSLNTYVKKFKEVIINGQHAILKIYNWVKVEYWFNQRTKVTFMPFLQHLITLRIDQNKYSTELFLIRALP